MRKSGLDVIGDIPWGFHFAVTYNSICGFRDTLAPYLKAGLENNELCVVITSDAFTGEDCAEILKENIPDFGKYHDKGQVEILPYTDWYLQNGKFSKEKALDSARAKIAASSKSGYEGLRIFGESSWWSTVKIKWPEMISYEKKVQKTIKKSNIVALCGYLTKSFSAHELLQVVSVHDSILAKENGAWVLINSLKNHSIRSEFERLKQILTAGDGTARDYTKDNDVIKTIREQIRHARKARGLTQAEIANKVKISPNFLGLIERGARTPSFKTMSKLAAALGLDLKDLVGEIKAVPKEKNEMIDKINGYLEDCTPHEKKLIYGFVRLLARERKK